MQLKDYIKEKAKKMRTPLFLTYDFRFEDGISKEAKQTHRNNLKTELEKLLSENALHILSTTWVDCSDLSVEELKEALQKIGQKYKKAEIATLSFFVDRVTPAYSFSGKNRSNEVLVRNLISKCR